MIGRIGAWRGRPACARSQAGRRRARVAWPAATALAVVAAPGCFTYSSYQSARIVERGEQQAIVAVSRSAIEDGGSEDEGSWYAIEGGGRFGIANRFDGAFLISVFRSVPEDWGAGVVTLDVRYGIVPDYLACALPVSVTVGDLYLASLRMQPGLVGTVPLGRGFEITGAVRAHVFVRATDLFAMGYNVGVGIPLGSSQWMARPEVGWMRFTGTDEGLTYMQYGVGVELNSRTRHETKERSR